jgi:hypothetical protein
VEQVVQEEVEQDQVVKVQVELLILVVEEEVLKEVHSLPVVQEEKELLYWLCLLQDFQEQLQVLQQNQMMEQLKF